MYNLNEQEILKVIFKNPTTKFYLLELSRQTKLHPNTVLTTLKSLEKKNLIKQEKKKYIKEIIGNKDNPEFSIEKKLFNLKQVYYSKILDFLIKKFNPESISIIGSYSRGDDTEESDIDVVIISKKEYASINLDKFEKFLGKKIHLIITSYNKISKEFYINLINGLVLYGAINKK